MAVITLEVYIEDVNTSNPNMTNFNVEDIDPNCINMTDENTTCRAVYETFVFSVSLEESVCMGELNCSYTFMEPFFENVTTYQWFLRARNSFAVSDNVTTGLEDGMCTCVTDMCYNSS